MKQRCTMAIAFCAAALATFASVPYSAKAQGQSEAPTEQALFFNGINLGHLPLPQSEETDRIVGLFAADPGVDEPPENIDQLVEGRERFLSQASFVRGIGGFYLEALLNNLNEAKEQQQVARVSSLPAMAINYISGRIVDWEFKPGQTDDQGYGRGSGRMVVETYITTLIVFDQNPGGPAPPPFTTALRWEIEVENDGFIIERRTTPFTDYTAQPFPKSAAEAGIVFPPTTIARSNMRKFDVKIWAKGEDIKVVSIGRALNYPVNSTFVELPPAQFPNYYQPDPANCVDMMLAIGNGNIPTNRQELGAPPFYCLGRCENPKIINTA